MRAIIRQIWQHRARLIPGLGIVAFCLCSVNALGNFLLDNAIHDTPLFWLAAVLIELVTAWLAWNIVEQMRKVTRSRITKQDRRFHLIILAQFSILAIPSLAVSVVANVIEFGGNRLLGLLFPSLAVASAVGVALPEAMKRRTVTTAAEKAERERKRIKRRTQAEASQREIEATEAQEQRNLLATLGKAKATLMLYNANPTLTQESAGQRLGISRQAVGQHLVTLEESGIIERGNGQIKVLWNLEGIVRGEEP